MLDLDHGLKLVAKERKKEALSDLISTAESLRDAVVVLQRDRTIIDIQMRIRRLYVRMWEQQGRDFMAYLRRNPPYSILAEAKTKIPHEVMNAWEASAEKATAKLIKDIKPELEKALKAGVQTGLGQVKYTSWASGAKDEMLSTMSPQFISGAIDHQMKNALSEINLVSMERLNDAIVKNQAKSMAQIDKAVKARIKSWNKPTGKGPGLVRARADLVARTEVLRAHHAGQFYIMDNLGEEFDMFPLKQSIPSGGNVCSKCQGAADQGWIEADEPFDNVFDDYPPFHIGCDCAFECKLSDSDLKNLQTEDEDDHNFGGLDDDEEGEQNWATLDDYKVDPNFSITPGTGKSDGYKMWANPDSRKAEAWILDNVKQPFGFDPSFKKAHNWYTGSGYNAMNTYLRQGLAKVRQDLKFRVAKDAKTLIDGYKKASALKSKTLVWRGQKAHATLDKISMTKMVGTEFTEKGFYSTSLIQETAVGGFSGGSQSYLFEIRLPSGTKVLSGSGFEEELILKPGTRYRVIAAKTENYNDFGRMRKVRHLILEIVK